MQHSIGKTAKSSKSGRGYVASGRESTNSPNWTPSKNINQTADAVPVVYNTETNQRPM